VGFFELSGRGKRKGKGGQAICIFLTLDDPRGGGGGGLGQIGY
jgi:hypothetical protein